MIFSLKNSVKAAAAIIFVAAGSMAGFAAPILKSNVTVSSSIVTVSDMFEDAGVWAEEALFRAPAPGTVGDVSLEAVRQATARIGLTEFENVGLLSVKVARAGVLIGETEIAKTLADHLVRSGNISPNMDVQLELSEPLSAIYAETGDTPLLLDQIRYVPGTNTFAARFDVAGRPTPITVNGRLFFTVEAPHLAHQMPAGSVISADDIIMRPISAQVADATGIPSLEDLIGKQVTRQMREGLLVRLADISDPIVVARNETVTLYLKSGQMTLTVRGQALNNASRGETVSVLNLVSNRVVRGIAVNPGTVEIAPQSSMVAAL